jgi:hypothetical protein
MADPIASDRKLRGLADSGWLTETKGVQLILELSRFASHVRKR